MKRYDQLTAMMAIARASFRSITRSPSAVVFTLLFPLIFILVFGFIGNDGMNLEVGIRPDSERDNEIFFSLQSIQGVSMIDGLTDEEINEELEKGILAGAVRIRQNTDTTGPRFYVDLQTSAAAPESGNILRSVIENTTNQLNLLKVQPENLNAEFRPSLIEGRKYSMIDFILPGQLGFAILSAGVFGTAFVFYNLRQTLVLKRFFATPIRRPYILLGEALSRMVFSLLGSAFLILIGYYAFGFTLINGFQTAVLMLMLAAIGLIVFMGFGFIISGLARNESMIPPLANIITLPQFLLSGTFFPIESFPQWLQPVCKALPLTYLNDALRKIAFEGAGLFDIGPQLFVILLWGVIAYLLAVKLFRWE